MCFKKLFTCRLMYESWGMQRNPHLGSSGLSCLLGVLLLGFSNLSVADENAQFRQIAQDYIDQMPALSPIGATQIGDHRFDGEMDDVSEASRQRTLAFNQGILKRLERIDRADLSRDLQVDAALLRHELRRQLWQTDTFQGWAWNPLIYTGKAGGAIYGLMAREFAPVARRLEGVTERLEKLPSFFEQVRATLQPARVPRVHAETAIKQNRGVLSIIDEMVLPVIGELSAADRERLESAIAATRVAVDEHGQWMEETMLPQAKGDFRIGRELFDQKLAFALHTPLSREQVKARAEHEFEKVRGEMYEVSCRIYLEQFPLTVFPSNPDDFYQQAIIRSALELSYLDRPNRGEIPDVARAQVKEATEFVIAKEIVTMTDDPLEIILMPEFQRGVSFAYCDAPGPLDKGLKTFYAVSPIPTEWTGKQVDSFLREYNIWSMHDLTMHEAVPGHYLQLAHSNQYPSTLRALLSSGSFVEGWAVYSERVMVDAGYLGGDDRMRLINLKWCLRGITNAMMDQAIHVDGMTREEAMHLMVEGGFQEEREAAGKWTRAQLTSAQLSTYFVGTQEHWDLRRHVEGDWGDAFTLKKYHDRILSFGSPPVQFVRALVMGEKIPE
jgi:uncharacterized protein (DUF885 family)